MHKIIIALAVVVAVLAVGVVVAVTYMGGGAGGGKVSVAQPAVTEPGPAVESSAAAPVAKAAPSPAAKPAAKPTAPAAKLEAAAGDSSAQNDDSSPEVKARIAALLDGLSPAEQSELMRQMREREAQRMRERARYALPSQFRLQALNRRRDGALKLSEYQQQQVDAIAESMKPKMDAALGPIWQKQDQLRQRAEALNQAGRASEAEPLQQEMRDLRQQTETVRNSLDQEYRQLLAGVLTPEQTQALDSSETPSFRMDRGAGRGEGQGRRASRGSGGGGDNGGGGAQGGAPGGG